MATASRFADSDRRYRGADRRASEQVDPNDTTAIAARWALLAAGVATAMVVVTLLALTAGAGREALGGLARGAVMGLALVVAIGAQLHWRVTGAAAGYHLATAAWLIAASATLETLGADERLAGAAIVLITQLLAVVWVGRAVTGPAVDSEGHVLRQLATAVVSGLLLWLLAWSVLEAASATTGSVLLGGRPAIAAGWLMVACLGLASSRRAITELQPWLPGTAFGFGVASLLRGLDPVVATTLAPAAAVVGVVALLVIATGIYQALAQRAASRRVALHQAQHAQQRSHGQRSLAERERTHELRNALLAVEGATNALERHRGHLDDAQRARLEQALTSGIAHLHDLLLSDRTTQSDATPAPVGEVVEQCAELARARGLTVHVDDRATTRALVRRVALVQIIDNLLANVERHAVTNDGPASAWVRIRSDAAEVRVEVTDDGPGLADRDRVFARGYREGDRRRDGDGLGLPVARRLAREQGGDLQVIPSAHGACFELRLPVAVDSGRTPTGGQETV